MLSQASFWCRNGKKLPSNIAIPPSFPFFGLSVVTKCLIETTERRQELFWFMVAEVSVCGCLAPQQQSYAEAEHRGREDGGEQSSPFMAALKQGERGRAGGRS